MTPPGPARRRFRSAREAETAAIGSALGRHAPDGAVLLLEGPLGAGKTTLAQGVAAGCGVVGPVTSPTYNLILRYSGARPFTHVDLYRLEDQAALATLDVEDALGGEGVTCVEWPELAERYASPPLARIRIRPEAGAGGARWIEVVLVGEGWDPARAALEAMHGSAA